MKYRCWKRFGFIVRYNDDLHRAFDECIIPVACEILHHITAAFNYNVVERAILIQFHAELDVAVKRRGGTRQSESDSCIESETSLAGCEGRPVNAGARRVVIGRIVVK